MNLDPIDIALYSHLVEILNYFVRQHVYRSKSFILEYHLPSRVAQLMACPEKHLRLSEFYIFSDHQKPPRHSFFFFFRILRFGISVDLVMFMRFSRVEVLSSMYQHTR